MLIGMFYVSGNLERSFKNIWCTSNYYPTGNPGLAEDLTEHFRRLVRAS